MEYLRLLCTFLCLELMLWACGHSEKKTSHTSEKISQEQNCLPLPQLPPDITSPEDRASFLAAHYWDGVGDVDSRQLKDTSYMEQSFSNFLAVLQYGSPDDIHNGMDAMVKQLIKDEALIELIDWTAYKYLAEPNSPMRSEDIYIQYLNVLINREDIPQELNLRAIHRLDQAMKNRPGMIAADFPLITKKGVKSSFHNLVRQDTTVVIFFDPECEQCKKTLSALASEPDYFSYHVLAVNVSADKEHWSESVDEFPENWEVAYATSPIEDDEKYVFPALPSFYLIAPDAKVLVKDFLP